ncbi:Protein Niban 2 [Saguinus oedipus]|uniref:Protein Niban 2 n=1 Tax=Saguinus oedipus TaxID=9490 RepID=A0ABQ9WFA8_SAGOE|nr:Protein Niban 2 [Saguinus oedipus]
MAAPSRADSSPSGNNALCGKNALSEIENEAHSALPTPTPSGPALPSLACCLPDLLQAPKPKTSIQKTGKILTEFLQFYEDQYGVALFNSMRHEIEGTGLPQAQLLWRKVPLDERIIFSGNLFQYQEDSKKWRNRFSLVPHNYGLVLYDNKVAYERQVPPRAVINSAGYKILTSMDQYLELVGNSLPGTTAKSGSTPILKCPTQFPLILWHPYARHYYFCMMTEAEQDKWQAVLQDCIRHCNNGLSASAAPGLVPFLQVSKANG